MITLLQIDKSGRDIFDKDYSIVIIVDKREIYGINIPQEMKDRVLHDFREGIFWKIQNEKRDKMRLRIRFHTAVIILLIRKILDDNKNIQRLALEVCNDFDAHFHEIKDMIFRNIFRIFPSFRIEDIVQTKFNKPSLIDEVAKSLRERKTLKHIVINLKINYADLLKIIKK